MTHGYLANLSFGQRGIRMAELLHPGRTLFAMPLLVRITGPLDVARLQGALDAVVARHDSLRARFPMVEGAPVQAVADALRLPLEVRRVTAAIDACAFEAEARTHAQAMAGQPFDLSAGPLARVQLLQSGDGGAMLVAVFHHIICDGASLDVFLRDLARAYDEIGRGEAGTRAPLELQYADVADHEQERFNCAGPDVAHASAVWRARLEGAPGLLDLPFDRARTSAGAGRSAQAHLHVPGDIAARLADLARARGATLFALHLALLFCVLRRWSGLDDLVVTVPVSQRDQPELADLIGLLVETLPIRATFEADLRFPALLAQVRDRLTEALAYRHLPFEQIVKASFVARSTDRAPFMQILFGMEDAAALDISTSDGTRFEALREHLDQAAKADLSVVHAVRPDGLHLWCRYDADRFDAATIDHLLDWTARLARAVVAWSDQPVLALPLLSDEEGRALVARFNPAPRPYEREATLIDLFRQGAHHHPDAIAILEQDRARTYGDLDERVRRLAHVLAAEGVEPGSVVLVALPACAALIEAHLALLTLGAVYAPIDPSHPADQSDARARRVAARHVIVADPGLRIAGCVALDIADMRRRAEIAPAHPGIPVTAETPACVMFTSGSSGEPKAVRVPHRAIVRLVCNTSLPIEGRTLRTAFYSNPAFDASTLEIWAPLLSGGAAVPVERTVVMDPRALRRFLVEARITLIWLTAGLFHQVAAEDPALFAGPRTVITGGDVVNPAIARAVLQAGQGTGLILVNGYGPTENTTFSTAFDLSRLSPDDTSIPIGAPIANSTAYVLDPRGRPLPPGLVGDIVVGGDGIALDYLGDPDLTAARFVPDPFSPHPQARMYRTGDLGRWRADGVLMFAGRADRQVKVRGVRIELGEIEAALALHPDVADAVVAAPRREDGERDLIAYVTARSGHRIDPQGLKTDLHARLASAQRPHAIAILEHLPLTANGKVDLRALPPVRVTPAPTAPRIAPRTPEEHRLAAIWTDLLGQSPASLEDNFFHVGGDSILTIRLAARAFEAGLDIDLKDVFEHPSLAGLAAVAARRRKTLAPQTSSAVHDLDLVPAAGDPDPAFRLAVLTLDRAVSIVDLGYALQRLAERHDALRLRRIEKEDRRRLVVADFLPAVPVRFADLPDGVLEDPRTWISAHRDRLTRGIDLGAGVTLAATLARQAEDPRAMVVLALHEAVADDRALLLLATELESALACGPDSTRLPMPQVSFSDWLTHLADQAGSARVREAALARERAGAAPAPVLTDIAPLACLRARRRLDAHSTRLLLDHLPHQLGVSVQDLLLVALGQALPAPAAIESVDGRRLLPPGAPRVEGLIANLDAVLPIPAFSSAGPPERRLKAVKAMRQQIEPLAWMSGVVGSAFAIPQASLGLVILAPAPRDRAIRLAHCPRVSPHVRTMLTAQRVDAHLELTFRGAALTVPPATLLERIEQELTALIACARTRTTPLLTPLDVPLARLDADQLDDLVGDDPEIEDLYPLSPMQEAMLLHTLSRPRSLVNFEQGCMRFTGRLDVAAFQRAWTWVFDRHAVLRTVLRWRGLARPLQMVRRAGRIPMEVETWSDFSAVRLDQRLARDRAMGFDLEQGPLARLTLIQIGTEDAYLISSFHHLVADGWCMAQLEREARAAYEAFRRGLPPALEPTVPFRDFIAWNESTDRAPMRRYFSDLLADAPHQPALNRSAESATFITLRQQLSERHSKALTDLSRRHGLTLGALAHLAWGLWSAARRGVSDSVFCTTVSGRPAQVSGVERMVGLFINNLPVRLRVAPHARLMDLVLEVQRQIAALHSHAQISLMEAAEAADVTDRADTLFDTLLVVENLPSGTDAWTGLDGLAVETRHMALKTAYAVTGVVVPGERIGLSLVLPDPDGTARAKGEAMIGELAALLAALPSGLDGRVSDLPLPGPAPLPPQARAAIAARQTDAPRRAPQGAVEPAALGVLRTLTHADLGPEEDVLAAGLSSLGLATAAARLGAILNRPVPVTLLIEHRTVAALAKALARDQAWDAVVPLTAGTQEPLICVHPIAGDVSAFLDLSRALPASLPIWALQAPGLEPGQTPLSRVEDLAAANLAALARRGLPAPSRLAGYSFGGLVAYDMARQLVARGAPPRHVILIDTPAPVGTGSILSKDPDHAEAQWLARMADVRARHHASPSPLAVEELLPLDTQARFALVRARLRDAGILSGEIDEAQLARAYRASRGLYDAFLAYAPDPDQARDLPLALIRADLTSASETGADGLGDVERRLALLPDMGWSQFVDGALPVVPIAGDHVSILVGENAAAVARAMIGVLA